MKTRRTLLFKLCPLTLLIALSTVLFSCKDEVDESDMYAFSGETAYSYMQKSQEYTDFAYILSKVKLSKKSQSELSQLLSARGNYTVFAPTNEAIQHYLDSIYSTTNYDLTTIPDSTAEYIARNSIIDNGNDNAYMSTDFEIGALQKTNLDDRYMTINFDTLSGGKLGIRVNTLSTIVQPDIEVSNGVIHGLNRVLELSQATLPALIKKADNLRIFSELLEKTGWADSMKKIRDEDYEANHPVMGYDLSGNPTLKNPEHRYYGFTIFTETDSVFENAWNIPAPKLSNNILQNGDEIIAAIAEKCREYYPDATSTDLRSQDNAVNQFIAYHILPERLTWDKIVIHHIEMGYAYNVPSQLSIDCYEYYETIGKVRRLMKITDGRQTDGKRINRHATYNYDDYSEISCDRPGIQIQNGNGKNLSNALNGFYYPIQEILVYDKDVPGVVLNERLRWDTSSLLSELMTNGYRRMPDAASHPFPLGYFSRLVFSDQSRCVYLPYNGGQSMSNYQADEMNIRGQYDFTLKLPPVPNEGTYELRFASPLNTSFGMAQFYFGSNPANLQPIGLPVDLRVSASGPVIGWSQDTSDPDVNAEIDKTMRNHGYMKAPRHDGISRNGAVVIESMRNTTTYVNNMRLRRIIWTGQVKPQDVLYIRVKSVLENTNACFLLDYMEWCPKQIYNGSEAEDQW
jgi:uncharacterized surface protein with fasciclin (FAS1) repeats